MLLQFVLMQYDAVNAVIRFHHLSNVSHTAPTPFSLPLPPHFFLLPPLHPIPNFLSLSILSPLFTAQTPSGLPTVTSYVMAPSMPAYHPATQVSPYMGYSATTSAYVTGPTWQLANGSALSPHSCDITTPLAFKSRPGTRDAIHPVTASAF